MDKRKTRKTSIRLAYCQTRRFPLTVSVNGHRPLTAITHVSFPLTDVVIKNENMESAVSLSRWGGQIETTIQMIQSVSVGNV